MPVVSLQLVKAGLALGLFGGTHKFLDDKVINQSGIFKVP